MTSWMYNWEWRPLVPYFGRLTWQVYAKLRVKSTRLLNTKNYAEIATNLESIRLVSGIKYRWKANNMIRPKWKWDLISRLPVKHIY